MKLQEIKDDIVKINEHFKKRGDFGKELSETLGRTYTPVEYYEAIRTLPWIKDYDEMVAKYKDLFYKNEVWVDDYDCSPLVDFLKITVALMEDKWIT